MWPDSRTEGGEQNGVFEAQPTRTPVPLRHLLAVWPWAGYFNSLSLMFPYLGKVEAAPSSEGHCEVSLVIGPAANTTERSQGTPLLQNPDTPQHSQSTATTQLSCPHQPQSGTLPRLQRPQHPTSRKLRVFSSPSPPAPV